MNDGISKHIIAQDITSFAATTTTLDATFRMLNVQRDVNNNAIFNTFDMNFCDAGAGNIPGGWGPYIYYRVARPLPAGSSSKPTTTDLASLCLDCLTAVPVQQRVITPINPTFPVKPR